MTPTTETKPAVPPVPTGKTAFPLAYAVEFMGETHAEIKYRRPNGGDMRKFLNTPKDRGDAMSASMVDLCELPQAFFDKLDGADYMAFANVLQGFLSGVRPTLTT
jgi:Phage tail assembly chaperone proteins, E, or 41 or 14